MGYTFLSLKRVFKNKLLFKDKSILTLGTLYPYITDSEFDILHKIYPNEDIQNLRLVPKQDFSDYLFRVILGAKNLSSTDVSSYQGSEIICDLNKDISDSWYNSYDIIFDGGTLEHLSNFPQSLKNIFNILVDNGIYYFEVPCNNWIDHGFFQFSPTFFEDLCIDNSNLNLLELFINDTLNYYSISSGHPYLSFIKRSIYLSKKKLNVAGIIHKKYSLSLEDPIIVSLIQTKYRDAYKAAKSPESKPLEEVHQNDLLKNNNFDWDLSYLISFVKKCFFITLTMISNSPFISVATKVLIFQRLLILSNRVSKIFKR
ncbi:class I SAM-dependent methyltransferase [Nodularia spumigena]|jgi:hypothetical protein|uniref:Class I SAM-dependent methyltransferase n=1 Tax=Nodularia spumigena UHCC 0060 TaxID=3110300 RepID=A0ABU5UXS7_NODSP|nr:class I SAM-dependent methyltransferase [Nodularia spumigena]MEA5526326.1 class I SAM-dependent methyltransferase [Nodularia spumigena UHCC 0143]MEA5611114.1 class I SAM-dependent methyltransferase [Nodularia spumigena UHCC 0060]MEA5612896.1 class I SAM-dependent methyltransferase [Nodularia spumigena UHCC 0040]